MSSAQKYNRYLMVWLPVLLAGFTMAMGLTPYWGFPHYYFRWYPLIPAYFTPLSLLMSLCLIRYGKRKPLQRLTAYMFLRVCKLALTAGALFLYYLILDTDMVAMVLATFVCYLFYLFIETWLFSLFEKKSRAMNK